MPETLTRPCATGCGRDAYPGRTRCNPCLARERDCAQCGRTFNGISTRCSICQAFERDCAECGRTFTGTHTRCNPCLARERDCAKCGRTFNGTSTRCSICWAFERDCVKCGRTFTGTETRCSPCRWQTLDSQERAARNAAKTHNRRALKKECGGELSVETVRKIRVSGICVYCGIDGARDLDHIVPLQHRGRNEESNITLACKKCNRSKGSKHLYEWAQTPYGRACVPYGIAHCAKVAAAWAHHEQMGLYEGLAVRETPLADYSEAT